MMTALNTSTDAAATARRVGVEFVADPAGRGADGDFVRRVPIAFARRNGLIGLHHDDGDGPLAVALSDPRNVEALQVVGRYLNRPVTPVLSPPDAVNAAIDAAYGGQTGQAQALLDRLDVPRRDDVLAAVRDLAGREDLLDVASRAPTIQLVNLILFEAVQARASDVHVQPTEHDLTVRMRIDGVLYDLFTLPKAIQEEVVSRLKVMGRMNIAEKRLPQDGRAGVQIGERNVDLRIASLPTSFGERVVVRLLDKDRRLARLGDLGMAAAELRRFRQLVNSEHGIVLVTGPTGSGKTTTLYAALREIDRTRRNVLTLEDPIEYQLEGVSQTQVSEKKGMTFAGGLRSVLRQDPDIIMVGEIRDRETAVMAIQSALTGHLVFSTLHTNDAASAVTRLLDLGIEPYLLASSLSGVLAQRLVRRVCPECGEATGESLRELEHLGVGGDHIQFSTARRGSGCPACRGTGYRGRLGLFELLTVDEPVRRQILARAAAEDVKSAATAGGMRTLHEDGVAKVLDGATTVEELTRVTMEGSVRPEANLPPPDGTEIPVRIMLEAP